MTPQRGDVVMVSRPKLPARIGRVERIGKRVYVRLPDRVKPKRYSKISVTVLLRTEVPGLRR